MTSEKAASKTGRYRRWLLLAGLVLTAVSALFLVRYAAAHRAALGATRIGPNGWALSAVGCAIYATGLIAVALGWLASVRACRDDSPAPRVIGIALVSQIGKYVPGNVAQHIGKAVYGGSRGMDLQVVAKSTVFEIASIAVAGGVVAAAGGAASPVFARLSPHLMAPLLSRWQPAMLGVATISAVLLALLFSLLPVLRRMLSVAPRPAAIMLALHILSITLLGLSFYTVVAAFNDDVSPRFCVALFAAAWLLGFVTPGAPAGLGVRETVLVLGLSGPLGPMALPAAILHRLVSALADAIAAGLGALMLRADKTSLSAQPAPPVSGPAGS